MLELTRTYPMPVHVMVLRYAKVFLFRTATVCGVLFLMVLVLALALEEDALPLDHEVSSGLDAFARMFIGVVGLGGVFGVLVLGAVMHDMYRREQRRALEELVEDGTAEKEWPPVAWQRPAIGESHTGIMILSFFGIVLGPLMFIAALFTFDSGDSGFSLGALGVSALVSAVSFLGLRSSMRTRTSSAEALWGDEQPEFHPQEPTPTKDSEGNPQYPGKRELARMTKARASLESAPPELVRLDKLDAVATKMMGAAMALFGLCAAAVILLTVIRKPCRNCTERRFGEGAEGLIEVGLLVSVALLVVGVVALVVATVLEGWVTLRLRRTILEMAEDATSDAPPWFLLRRLLLEETPMQALTGHLHTLGITFLAFGFTASMVSDQYPLDEWKVVYPVLMTLGGVLLLFHLSGWFWKREATRKQNEALLARWPD